jgi:hypothetical protein
MKALDSAYTIEGVLQVAAPHELVITRNHPQAGLTAVHLPRAGFVVKRRATATQAKEALRSRL